MAEISKKVPHRSFFSTFRNQDFFGVGVSFGYAVKVHRSSDVPAAATEPCMKF
jgi:hypothetical protein